MSKKRENGVDVIIDGVKYEFSGYMGAFLSSRENGVKKGDVRYIKENLYHAFIVDEKTFKKNRVSWSLMGKHTTEQIKKIKKDLVGIHEY